MRRRAAGARERHAAVHELLQAAKSQHAVSRILSLSRPAVRRFAHAASPDELMDGALGKGPELDPFKPCLHQRRDEGITDAAVLHAELRQRGFAGSVRTVRRHLAPFRGAAAAPGPVPAVPKARQITRWLLSRPEHLQPGERTRLDAIRASCPHIDVLAGRISSFAEMMTARTGDRDLEEKMWPSVSGAVELPPACLDLGRQGSPDRNSTWYMGVSDSVVAGMSSVHSARNCSSSRREIMTAPAA